MHSIEESRSYCSACPKMCHFSCPVAEVEKNEAYSPTLKQQTAKLIEEKKLPLNQDHALAAYKCLSCRASREYCDHKIQVTDSLQALREKAVLAHAAPSEVYLFEKKFKKFNNPYGIDLQKKIKTLPSECFSPKKAEVFFPTCHQLALNPHCPNDYLKLFKKLKANSLRVADEAIQCCGYSLWSLGFKEEFEEMAHIQFYHLQGAKKIVVGSPECAWAMKELYPKLGMKWKGEVLSLFEYVANRFQEVPFQTKLEASQKYMYHDACYMGRYLGQYERPRQWLEMLTGVEVEEFYCHGENSICSGAGGGYKLHAPLQAKQIAQNHLQEMKEKGIKVLITACPQSAEHFRRSGEKIIVKDLVGFLGEQIVEMKE